MKKILLVFLLLGLFSGCVEKPSEKEKSEVFLINLVKAEEYYNRGNIKFNLKNYEEAILDYNMAIELNPKFEEAYHNRGVTKRVLKRLYRSYFRL